LVVEVEMKRNLVKANLFGEVKKERDRNEKEKIK